MKHHWMIAGLLSFALLLPSATQAQTPETASAPEETPRYDISAGGGACSFMGLTLLVTRAFFEALGESLHGQPHSIETMGCYSLQGYRQMKPWLQLGGKLVFENTQDIVYTDKEKTMEDYRFYTPSVALMPSIRFTYLHKPYVRLYSGLELGACYLWEQNPKVEHPVSQWIFAFNVTPLGLQAGRKWYGMLETNIWTDAIVKIGVGYRFF